MNPKINVSEQFWRQYVDYVVQVEGRGIFLRLTGTQMHLECSPSCGYSPSCFNVGKTTFPGILSKEPQTAPPRNKESVLIQVQ